MSTVAAPLAGPSSRARSARSAADVPAVVATVAWVGLCALVIAAPFEALKPLVTLAGQSLSSVEAVMLAALAVWALGLASARSLPLWRTPLTLPWLAVVAAMTIAAVSAPAFRLNALNMTGRFAFAFLLYLLVVNCVTTVSRLRAVFSATAVASAAVVTLAVLEYLGVEPVLEFLAGFRAWAALVGGQLRASGPLQYPTIASMFLEIGFAFVLGLMLMAIDRRRGVEAVVLAVLAIAIVQGIIFTFTRAGLITIASTIAVMGWLRYRGPGFDRGVLALAIVGSLFLVQVGTSRSLEYLRLRMTTETMEAWFRAEVRAPRDLELATGSRTAVPVRIRNIGGATWDSSMAQPIRLSYHWLMAHEDTVVSWEGLRTPFPARVAPGASVALSADVEAPPEPGEYRLMWDVEQEHRLWFSTEPDAPLYVTRAVVSGPAVGPRQAMYPMALPRTTVRPGRLVLWRAAADLFATRPWLGIGPDNYRLKYGEYAGLANFDRRVHSNNMYIEMFVGAGLIGGLAFLWLCAAAGRQIFEVVRLRYRPTAAALAAATVAILLHGLVDSFLSFTPTYVLIAVTLGLASCSLSLNRGHAHRI